MLSCEIEKEGETFRVATTHFTWTPDGSADDYQRADVKKLLAILGGMGEFVLTGDFNAPRGGEIFGTLAEKYKDNVPSHYTTSIDGALHRAGPLELMVDGIFSTPGYAVSDVELVAGVSDHKAIVATVSSTD
jgi:endonuclease/exonuclease/phosphatase family metal-dependent hydrolase